MIDIINKYLSSGGIEQILSIYAIISLGDIMELIDVYDINRKKLNYTKVRGTLDNNEYNIASELWLINNHKLLITKRAINKSHPNEWEVPGGCSIINENTLDTLIREIKEEINISLNTDDCMFIDTYIYKNQFLDIYKSTYFFLYFTFTSN